MIPGVPLGMRLPEMPAHIVVESAPRGIFPKEADWTKPDEYPKSLSRRAWGWEFLRRNPNYILDWAYDELKPGRYRLADEIDPSVTPYEPPVETAALDRRFRATLKHYPLYLRVWDARLLGGAKIAEIAATIYPDRKNRDDAVKKDIKAASQLVWIDYRNLLQS